MPLSLLTGPFIPELIIIINSLIFLTITIKEKSWNYYKNKFVYFFVILYFYLVIRSLFSVDQMLSLESSLFYFRYGLFSLATWFILSNNRSAIKNFSIFTLFTFCLVIIDGYYQFSNNQNLFGIINTNYRMSLTFNDNLFLGGWIVRMFPLLIGTLIYSFSDKKINIIVFIILFILTDVLVFISGERTALGLLLMASLFILMTIDKFKIIRIITLLISIIIMIYVGNTNNEIRNRVIGQTLFQLNSQIEVINDSGEKEYKSVIFSIEHNKLIRTALSMYNTNKLFGHGTKMFRVLCSDKKYQYDKNSCSTHPHNIYFQILAEVGLIGLIFILIPAIYFFVNIFKHIYLKVIYKKLIYSDFQICLLTCFIIALWPFFPTLNLFNNWINIVCYLPVGFYLFTLNQVK